MEIDILGDVLGGAPPVVPINLRYDYSQIDAAHRGQVQAAAIAIVRNGRKAQENMIEMGRRLLEVKAVLPHGQFSDWCETEFNMSQRTVQRMMSVAETFSSDEKRHTVSLFSDSALYLLAAPSVPEEARNEVIQTAQATGISPTKEQVQQVIDQHKGVTYATIRELERQVRSCVEAKSLTAQQLREAVKKLNRSILMLLQQHIQPPYRRSDFDQAVNNVADQLEQETKRRAAAASPAVAPVSPASPPAASVATPIAIPITRASAAKQIDKPLIEWTDDHWNRYGSAAPATSAIVVTPPVADDNEAAAFAAARQSLLAAAANLQAAQHHLAGWHDELSNMIDEIIAHTRRAIRELD